MHACDGILEGNIIMSKKRTRGQNHVHKKEKKKKKHGSYYVADGVDREILLRLPVKSLLRFRCLNKKFRDMISTQQFVNDHLDLETSRRDGNFLLLNRIFATDQRYRLFTEGGGFSVPPRYSQDLAPPYGKTDYKTVLALGYCNGVVLLMAMHQLLKFDAIFWNPSMKRSIKISTPFWFEHFRYGFGCVNGEYKLVGVPYTYEIGFPVETGVCSSKTRSWKTAICSWTDPFKCEIVRWRLSTFVNGACHWFAKEHRDGAIAHFLLSFNLAEETYGKIAMPSDSSEWDSMHVYGESLALIETMNKKTRFVVWVMKKYGEVDSWTKIIESVNLNKGIGYMLGFTRRGDVVYSRRWRKKLVPHYNELVCYNPVNTRTRYWKAKHTSERVAQLYFYRENLKFLNQDLQISEN